MPQKFKTSLWLIFHNKLPINLLRARRGITPSDLRLRCNNSKENLEHLFRDCPKASMVWDFIPLGRLRRDRFANSISDWISTNLKKKKLLNFGTELPWSMLFCTTL